MKYSAKTNISNPRVYQKQTVQHINTNSTFPIHTHKNFSLATLSPSRDRFTDVNRDHLQHCDRKIPFQSQAIKQCFVMEILVFCRTLGSPPVRGFGFLGSSLLTAGGSSKSSALLRRNANDGLPSLTAYPQNS
jgi:hypothetical protein